MYKASDSPSCEVCTCTCSWLERKKNVNKKKDHLLTLKISRYVVFLDGNMYRKQKGEEKEMMTGRYIAMDWIIDGFSLCLNAISLLWMFGYNGFVWELDWIWSCPLCIDALIHFVLLEDALQLFVGVSCVLFEWEIPHLEFQNSSLVLLVWAMCIALAFV